ncbi:PAS domain S-box protein [Parasediminibacterium sp. JCM 36343]|uniref:PAS domain S-box protein n=1 Tax=Parasediminibacterium sp. JCM 36343 TaxID=3374279 RepID=UPI00397A89FF
MITPALPENEAARLKALERFDLLDTIPEDEYDNITYLASLICQTPISQISIIDRDRVFVKSSLGLEIGDGGREFSFCAHAINTPNEIFETENARLDERFSDNPYVAGDPGIVFYAGVPLVTDDGFALGALCVVDTKPHKLSEEQRIALKGLSKQVVYMLGVREKRKLEEKAINEGAWGVAYIKEDGSYYKVNEALAKMYGYQDTDELAQSTIFDNWTELTEKTWKNQWKELKEKKSQSFVAKRKKKDGAKIEIEARLNFILFGNLELICIFYLDITDKKKLDEQLKLVDFAFRNTSTPISFINKDGGLFDFNDATCQLLGYTKDEYKNLNVIDLNPAFNAQRWAERWEEIKAKPGEMFYVVLTKKDGSKIDIEVRAKIIQYQDIEINCATYIDITEKKETEQKLRLVDHSFNTAKLPMLFLTRDGAIYNYNNAICQLLEYSFEEFGKLTNIDFTTTYTSESWKKRFDDIKAGHSLTFERKLKKKDHILVDVRASSNAFEYHGIELVFVSFFDISEEKKLEAELRLTKYAFDNSNVGMHFINKDGSIYNFNKKAAELLGYTKSEYAKISLNDFVQKKYTNQEWNERWEFYRATNELSTELKLKKKDGVRMYAQADVSFISFEDFELLFVTFNDISEKKKAVERLKLSDYIIKNATTAIYLLTPEGAIYDFNEAAYTMLGYTKEEFAMLHQINIDPTLNATIIAEGFEGLRKEGTVSFQHKIVKKGGDVIDVEIVANFLEYNGLELNCSFVTDISEKKKAEAEINQINEFLQLQTNRLLLATSSASMGIWYWDVKNDKMVWDKRQYQIYDINESELGSVYEGWLSRLHPEDKERVNEVMQSAIAEKKREYSSEFRIIWDDLSVHYIKGTGITEYDDNGNVIQMTGVNWDVTAEREIEAEKKQLTNRLLLATKSAQLGIWEWDLENDTLLWDEGMYKIYGISENEFNTVYEGWISRLHEEDRKEIDNEIQLAITNEKDYNSEFRIVWSDSSIHYIGATGIVEREEGGKPKRMIGVNWDITAEKESVRHLKLLESVITNSKDSILITEAEPFNQPGPKIMFVNPAFTKMTGYTPEEVIGKTPRMLQNEETDTKELDKLRVAMNNWESVEITVSNAKKNGEKFWNNFNMVPVANEKGWFTHWIAVERDVTKEKEAAIEKEKLLQELIKSNKELSQFSYITTHNLRAPLTNLISICNLIKTDKIEDERTRKFIEAFKVSTHYLNDTLNDLIKILIIKENTNWERETVSFKEVLGKVTTSIHFRIVNLVATIKDDFSEVESVQFSSAYMESVLLNLITNSLRYAHPERHPLITIKTTIELDGGVKLVYADNGIGIDLERVKNRVFGLYQRFHSNPDGKGMGLYLIHSQITSLGGTIEIESEVNVGTTFTIRFKK